VKAGCYVWRPGVRVIGLLDGKCLRAPRRQTTIGRWQWPRERTRQLRDGSGWRNANRRRQSLLRLQLGSPAQWRLRDPIFLRVVRIQGTSRLDVNDALHPYGYTDVGKQLEQRAKLEAPAQGNCDTEGQIIIARRHREIQHSGDLFGAAIWTAAARAGDREGPRRSRLLLFEPLCGAPVDHAPAA